MTTTERTITDAEACEIMRPTARRYAKRLCGRDRTLSDDLVQEGLIGAIEAAKTFDPTRPLKFTTYAHHRVVGRMIDYLRDNCDHLTRLQRQKVNNGGDEPFRVFSLDAGRRSGKGEDDSGGDKWRFDPPHYNPENADTAAEEFAAFVRDRFGRVSYPSQMKLLAEVFIGGDQLWKIGDRLGLSENMVSRMVKAAIREFAPADTNPCLLGINGGVKLGDGKVLGHRSFAAKKRPKFVRQLDGIGISVVSYDRRQAVVTCPHCAGRRRVYQGKGHLYWLANGGAPPCENKGRIICTREDDPCPPSPASADSPASTSTAGPSC